MRIFHTALQLQISNTDFHMALLRKLEFGRNLQTHNAQMLPQRKDRRNIPLRSFTLQAWKRDLFLPLEVAELLGSQNRARTHRAFASMQS
jgi:hypothetical protein